MHRKNTMTITTVVRRALAGVAAGAALVIGMPLAASAHVTISPNEAEAGSWTYVTFRMPTESDTASTVALDVALPTDTPFTSVSFEPVPGWTGEIVTETLPEPVEVRGNTITEAATSISFTADGPGVAPGQFQTFTVALGPVPDVGHLVLPATQTYSDGTVVEWHATPEQIAEDDSLSPAPVLWVGDTPPADAHHHATDDEDAATADAAPETSASDGSGGIAIGLSIAALIVGIGAALLGALAFARSRATR